MIENAISKLVNKYGKDSTKEAYKGIKNRSSSKLNSVKRTAGEAKDDLAKLLHMKATKREKSILSKLDAQIKKASDPDRYGNHVPKGKQVERIKDLQKKKQRLIDAIQKRKDISAGASAAAGGAAAYSMFSEDD